MGSSIYPKLDCSSADRPIPTLRLQLVGLAPAATRQPAKATPLAGGYVALSEKAPQATFFNELGYRGLRVTKAAWAGPDAESTARRGRPTAPGQSSVNSAAGTGGPK